MMVAKDLNDRLDQYQHGAPFPTYAELREIAGRAAPSMQEAAPEASKGNPRDWLIDGSLLYRLNDDETMNADEINVTMAHGSRKKENREAAAMGLLSIICASEAAIPVHTEPKSPKLTKGEARTILDMALDLEKTGRICALSTGQDRSDYVARNRATQCALTDILESLSIPANSAPAPSEPNLKNGFLYHAGLDIKAVLYTDDINGKQVLRDDLWLATTEALNALRVPPEPVLPAPSTQPLDDRNAALRAAPAGQHDAAERVRFEDWWHEGAHPYRDLGGKKKPLLNENSAWHVWLVATAPSAPVSAPVAPTGSLSEKKLSDYAPGQWWLAELERHWGHGELTGDTRRAAKIACDFAALVFANSPLAVPLPADQSEAMTTDEAREYLVEYMMANFTDKTFHRYIRGQRGQVNLAGDFAWQIARALKRPCRGTSQASGGGIAHVRSPKHI